MEKIDLADHRDMISQKSIAALESFVIHNIGEELGIALAEIVRGAQAGDFRLA